MAQCLASRLDQRGPQAELSPFYKALASFVILGVEKPWERLLAAGLARDFQAMRLDFLARHGGISPVEAVTKWQKSSAARITAFRTMIDRARLTAAPSTAMLAQIAGQARELLNRP